VLFGLGRGAEGVGLKNRHEVVGKCECFLRRASCPRSLKSAEKRGRLNGVFEVLSGLP
jgi:hypothetical protein